MVATTPTARGIETWQDLIEYNHEFLIVLQQHLPLAVLKPEIVTIVAIVEIVFVATTPTARGIETYPNVASVGSRIRCNNTYRSRY